jgi:hypothetical protein
VQACPLSVPSAFPVRQPTSCWPLRRPSCGLAERAHAPIARLPLQPEGESLEWRSSTALEAVPAPEVHPTNPAAHPCVCPHSPRRRLAHTAGRAGAGAARGLLLHGAGLAGRRISGVSGVFEVGRTGALGWTSRGGGSGGGGGMMPGFEVLRGTCVGSGFSSCSRYSIFFASRHGFSLPGTCEEGWFGGSAGESRGNGITNTEREERVSASSIRQ